MGSFRLLLAALILGVSLAEDAEGPEFAGTKIGHDRTLICKPEDDDATMSWSFTSEDSNDTRTVAEGEKYKIDGSNLIVKDVQEEDLGVYRCSEDGEEIAAFHLDISVRVKKFPPSFSIDEGSSTDPKKSLKCEVFSADQEIQFKWFSRPEDEDSTSKTLNPVCAQTEDNDCSVPVAQPLFEKKDSSVPVVPLSERMTIKVGKNEEGIPFSTLEIKDTDKTDRRVFICQASVVDSGIEPEDCKESKHCDQTETIMRVKDPLAAVWPFCGIVVEVILLCVIIFFCEKKKTGSEKEDYDEGSNGNNIGSSRQRK